MAFILPSKSAYVYSWRAARTFFKYTPPKLRPVLIHCDDASENYDQQDWDLFYSELPRERCCHHHFAEPGGLTRSWNHGLHLASELGCQFAIAGNSDVLFTPGWYEPLCANLVAGVVDLIGPVTNAPGRSNKNNKEQGVQNFLSSYVLSDRVEVLHDTAKALREKYPVSDVRFADVNGFFMMALTTRWISGAFSKQDVFDPAYPLTGNEDELQRRWKRRDRRFGYAPASFIFHYRSVTRGARKDDYGVFRLQDANQPV